MSQKQTYTDVFISYRRLDVDFVKGFVDELKAQGKEVWIDWEDIPPGSVGFTDDIRRGLESSDSFICVLSPDYLESSYCIDLELGYALELRKKIIPIVYRKFDDKQIPAGISHINWIYFEPHAGQENTFDESFPRVIEALDTDFDYVREHTRLLQRVQEWQDNERNNSYLLRGIEIIEAEQWLAQSAIKQPLASQLHHEFIHNSRHWENQKTRRNLTIAIIVTILSIILAGFAFVQRQSAIEQRAIAEEQRAIAVDERNRAEEQQRLSDSRRLAMQSLVALSAGEVDLSLLLGLESIRSADTPEALGSLVKAFEESPYLDTYLYAHDAVLTAIAYHPTEPLMVTGAEDGTLVIWDMDSLDVLHRLSLNSAEIWDIAYHPDGSEFVVGADDGSLYLYDAHTGDEIRQLAEAHQGIITSVTYSPDGQQLLTTSYDGNAIIWESSTLLDVTPQKVIVLPDESAETTHTDWILDADFSPDGSQIVLIAWDNVLQIWDIASGELVADPLKILDGPFEFSLSVAWSPDGRFILTGDAQGNIRYVNPTNGQLLDATLSRHFDHVREIAYSPDGPFFASVSHDGKIILWNANSGQLIVEAPIAVHANHVNDVAFSSDGRQMISVGDDGRAVVFDMTRPDLLGQHILTHESEIYQVTYLENHILSAGLDGNIYLTDTLSNETEIAFSPDIERITAADVSADETLLIIATDVGLMQLWDLANRVPLTDSFTAHSATIFSVAFSPDGTQIASASDDQRIALWDVNPLIERNVTENGEMRGHDDGVLGVAWHPSLPILASASRDKSVRLWDVESSEVLATLNGHEDAVEDVLFNTSGDWLVSASRDHQILLWDVEEALSGADAIAERLVGHSHWVLSLAFSPDGEYLVSGSRDRSIILWDLDSLQILGKPLTNHEGWVWSIDVSADGQSVVSGGRDSRMVVWDVDFTAWQDLACHIANRPLNPDEWVQFRPDSDYTPTCG